MPNNYTNDGLLIVDLSEFDDDNLIVDFVE